MKARTIQRPGLGRTGWITLLATIIAVIAGAGRALPASAVPGAFEFDAISASVSEGNSLDITLTRGASGEDAGDFVQISVDALDPEHSAEVGDYDGFPVVPSWNGGVNDLTLLDVFEANEDADVADEVVVLVLSRTQYGIDHAATLGDDIRMEITIIDDDVDRVQFESTSHSVNEADGSVSLKVVRSGPLDGPASVDYTTIAGSAVAGTDYVAVDDTLEFADGQAMRFITIDIVEDGTPEGPQTFVVILNTPVNTDIGVNDEATVTINDAVGSFRFVSATYMVAEGSAAGEVVLMVERIGGTTGAATVQYATADGAGASGADAGSDYTSTSGTLTFSSGETDDPIVVPILNDANPEGTETFTVTLSNPGGGPTLSAPITATVSITDNDGVGTFVFSAADYSAVETAGTATITVLRQGTTSGAASVSYSTSAGSATAAVDYTQIALTVLSFVDGQPSKTFAVTIIDDLASETNETVNLTLSSPSSGYTLGTQQTALLTIVDNETQQPIVASVTPVQGPSSGGNLVTITGSNLLGATQVLFGSTAASISNATNTQVLVIAPAGAAGPVNVRVTTPVGTSAVTTNGVYTYLPVPAVTGVSPQNGPLNGGTAVIITGSNFTGATGVLFGSTAASSFTVISNAQINAVSPAGAAGDVQVRVQNANGLSATSLATRFTYGAAASPTVTIALVRGWSFKTWLGKGGLTPSQALHGLESPDNPATNDIYNVITVIWYWNGVQWLAFFPAGVNVPGANTLTSMPYGQPIWIYLNADTTNWVTLQGP